jgi:hypothetical protein
VGALARPLGSDVTLPPPHGRKAPPPAPAGAAVLGYASRLKGQRPDGHDLRAQAGMIEDACARRGWRLVELVSDLEPADGNGMGRPGLTRALRRLAAAEAGGLVVASLDRLSRSASDLATLIEWCSSNGVRLVVADLGLDTTSPEGRLSMRTLVAVGGFERQRGDQPTRRSAPPPEPRRPSARPAAPKAPALKERTAAIRARGTKLLTAFESLKVDAGSMLRGRLSRGTGRRGALGLLAAGAVVTAGVAGFVTGHTGGGAAPSRGPTAGEVAPFRHHERRKQLERAAAAMKRLDAVRVDGRSRLARARTSTAQARAAAELARAHGAAAGALASPLTKPLAAELRRSQRGYLALADAARRDDESAYGEARSSINQADARVQHTIKALRLP